MDRKVSLRRVDDVVVGVVLVSHNVSKKMRFLICSFFAASRLPLKLHRQHDAFSHSQLVGRQYGVVVAAELFPAGLSLRACVLGMDGGGSEGGVSAVDGARSCPPFVQLEAVSGCWALAWVRTPRRDSGDGQPIKGFAGAVVVCPAVGVEGRREAQRTAQEGAESRGAGCDDAEIELESGGG